MKVIAAYLHEGLNVVGVGNIEKTLPGPKFPDLKMSLIDQGVLCQRKDINFIIPITNFKAIVLANAEPKKDK